MKKQIITLTAAAALAFGATVFAEDTNTNMQSGQGVTQEQVQAAKKAWHDMTPEEKKEFRAEVKKTWDNMTPEQQAEVKKRAHNKWKSMSPEQKKELIDKVVAEKSNGTTSTN